THRPGRDFAFASEREFARKEAIRSTFVHHEHDHVCLRATNLQANTAALNADSTRSGPALAALISTGQIPLSVLTTDNERALLQTRYNYDAVCLFQQVLRNAFIRRCHDL